MTNTPDIVVIGAGIAGASAAYFCAVEGMRVVVVEKDMPASGATGRTAAYIRCHYANPHEARFAIEGWEIHTNWAEVVGGDSGFRKVGFLLIVPERERENLVQNVEFMRSLGVKTELLDGAGLRELLPYAVTDDVAAAAYEPESGYADPSDAVSSLLAGAKRRGARVILDAKSVQVLTERGHITGVRAGDEVIAAPKVIIAAGAGSRDLARQAGADIPVLAMPIGAGLLHRPEGVGAPPCTIDLAAELWYRGDVGDHLLIGAGYEDSIAFTFKDEPEDVSVYGPPTRDELVTSGMRLTRRIPEMEAGIPVRTWLGMDSRTPDGHAIAGPVESVPGLHLFTGGNGKLFKLGPSMGRALAKAIATGRFAESPLAPFSLERYTRGGASWGEHEYGWGSFA